MLTVEVSMAMCAVASVDIAWVSERAERSVTNANAGGD